MYTVKKVSEISGISTHTIRFYDNEGLFPFVHRDKNNVRLFSDNNLEWINMVHCLKETGMSISDIRKYIDLCNQGDSTAEERYAIILKQKEKAEQEVIKMQKRVDILNKKIDFYKILVEEEHGDFINPSNCMAMSMVNKS